MSRVCTLCSNSFEITEADRAFHERVSPVLKGKKYMISPPDLCASCRMRRRAAFRNERSLYIRTCDLCKKSMVSIFSPDKTYPVYCIDCWWSDRWDSMQYGREFDFTKSFSQQWGALFDAIPKLGLFQLPGEVNSAYTQDNTGVKNCYMTFDGEGGEDSYYGETFIKIKDCCDFLGLQQTELAYECVQCQDCYNITFCRFCRNCSDSAFLLDCQSCKHCIACTNLSQKEFCIFNEQYTKEEYEKKVQSYDLRSRRGQEKMRTEAERFFLSLPRRANRNLMSENVTGDDLIQCKNVFDSFDCIGLHDARFCSHTYGASDCYDVDGWGNGLSLAYDSVYVGGGAQDVAACFYVGMGGSNVYHSAFCIQNVSNLFGCIAVMRRQYCILNKQYTKDEYEKLMPRIFEHLQKTGELGQFFGPELSAYAYNESVAQDYFPLNEAEAEQLGFTWHEAKKEIPVVKKIIDAAELPDTIDEVPDDIINWAIRCMTTRRPFRIQGAELNFYRKMHIPIPQHHFEIRHAARLSLRNPRHVWQRQCQKCGVSIDTTYSPKRPEIVYCERCYLETVY